MVRKSLSEKSSVREAAVAADRLELEQLQETAELRWSQASDYAKFRCRESPVVAAEAFWGDALRVGGLVAGVVAPASVPLIKGTVTMGLVILRPLAEMLFSHDAATQAKPGSPISWEACGWIGAGVAAIGALIMIAAVARRTQLRRQGQQVNTDRVDVASALNVVEATGTPAARALLTDAFLSAKAITSGAGVLAGRVDLQIDADAEAAAVAVRVGEVERLRRDYGVRPAENSAARDRWDAAGCALDQILDGLGERVEALVRYERQIGALAAAREALSRAECIESLDDRLGQLVHGSAVDDFAAADTDRLTQEIADLTAGLRAMAAWLNGDQHPVRAGELALSSGRI